MVVPATHAKVVFSTVKRAFVVLTKAVKQALLFLKNLILKELGRNLNFSVKSDALMRVRPPLIYIILSVGFKF